MRPNVQKANRFGQEPARRALTGVRVLPPSHVCPECTSLLAKTSAACPTCLRPEPGQGWAPLSKQLDPLLGRIIDGRYMVLQRIGDGSQGLVYRIESVSSRRELALKLFTLPEESNKRVVALHRLGREVDATSQLRDPHIARVYEVVQLSERHSGLVMDLVSGQTLEALVYEQGPLSPSQAVELVRQIASALYEAHSAHMIHRDIKPANIMVESMPLGERFVHLLDFGLVKMTNDVSVTVGYIGTPMFSSPEQAMAGDLDCRTDIYSLGAVLYFMLTGQTPFDGNHPIEVLDHHILTRPLSLSEANPVVLFCAHLEQLVADMLEKDRERRPLDMRAVIKRLSHVQAAQNDDTATEGLMGVDSTAPRTPEPASDAPANVGFCAIARVETRQVIGQSQDPAGSPQAQQHRMPQLVRTNDTLPQAAIFKRARFHRS